MDLHAGTTMDVKNQPVLQDLNVGITMDGKNQPLFKISICRYCIFEMTLWKL
jgi:hypothetical protein